MSQQLNPAELAGSGLPGGIDGADARGAVVRTSVLRRLLRNPLAATALVVLVAIIIIAALAPVLAPFTEHFANFGKTLASPDAENLLGTDSAGRDVWSRLLFGARLTLASAALALVVGISIGVPAGLLAGYYQGLFDQVANWVVNVLMSLPNILVLLAVSAAFSPSVWLTMFTFGILISPSFFRMTRAAVQSVRGELYVDAARVAGLSDVRVIGRHIVSVVRAPLIIQAAALGGVAIAIQSGLEFLGLGDPTVSTWGVMLSDGFRNVYLAPLNLLWPALAIGLTIGSLALVANGVRDALEDRARAASPRRRRQRAAVAAPTVAASDERPAAAAPPSDHLLEVSGLRIGYPQGPDTIKTVVEDVSFHVDRGEVLGVVGESGSGKSQTAFAILGLLPPEAVITGGRISIDGRSTVPEGSERVLQSELAKLRGKRVAYVPQEPMSNLDPAFTVGSQLIRPMVRTLGISKQEARKRAEQLLTDVGIPDPQRTMRAYPHEISGGMAQRVLIAGAISGEPDLIIADEPTTALDVTVQAEVLDLLRDLQKRLGMGVVIVTHNFGVVADLCDRVVVMQHGRIVEEGDVRTILRTPAHPYTRMLLDSTLEGKTPMTKLVTADKEVHA